ncbi:toxin-antitoxin system YwqK family antitoxin [Persicirhabdus sediminis]|uniref:Antitoxin component YwqK of the YwqJK toxin-antitoxin module n=1 Tax=Persicirhabdus sediminis TaxID=454144 RepID=A0A8J7MDX6_9BACT|nr:hypothetical protein [Persicirhabdus sediminis]MBK1790880.1 hypothetical protein [Persicirhabdus sediminis]
MNYANCLLLVVYLCIQSFGYSSDVEPRELSADHVDEKRSLAGGLCYIIGEKEPYTGILTEIRTVDLGRYKYTYEKGILNGVQRSWHSNGLIENEHRKLAGLEHGLYRSWSYEGTLILEQWYKLGLRSGPSMKWHSNGFLKSIAYYENDVIEGAYVSFHANGEIDTTYFMKNGKLDGPLIKKDKHGKEISKKYYSASLDKEITEEEWYGRFADIPKNME